MSDDRVSRDGQMCHIGYELERRRCKWNIRWDGAIVEAFYKFSMKSYATSRAVFSREWWSFQTLHDS